MLRERLLPNRIKYSFRFGLLTVVTLASCQGSQVTPTQTLENSPYTTPTATETITPAPTASPTPTLEIISSPTLEPTPTASPTSEPTPKVLRTPKTTPKTPEIVTPTAEMIDGLIALDNFRTANGLPALPLSKTLTKIAVWKADDMNKNNYFSHTDSLGEDIVAMDTRLGYTGFKVVGENIYRGNSALSHDAKHVVDAFSKSPSHRELMLGTWATVGIGYSYNPATGLHYWTEEFGTRLDASIYTPPAPTPKPTLSPTEQPTPTPNPEPTSEPTPVITPVPTLSPEPTTAYDPHSPSVLVFDARRRLIEDYGKLPKVA